jgi:hypothetical protein
VRTPKARHNREKFFCNANFLPAPSPAILINPHTAIRNPDMAQLWRAFCLMSLRVTISGEPKAFCAGSEAKPSLQWALQSLEIRSGGDPLAYRSLFFFALRRNGRRFVCRFQPFDKLRIDSAALRLWLLCEQNDSVTALVEPLSKLPSDRSLFEPAEDTYTIGSTWALLRAGITICGVGIGKTVPARDRQFNGIMVNRDVANNTISDLTLNGNGTANVIFLSRPKLGSHN